MFPSVMQPTHACIEQVVNHGTTPRPAADQEGQDVEMANSPSDVFPPLSPRVARNTLVMDVHMEHPPVGISTAAYDVAFRTSASNRRSLRTQIFSTRNDPIAPFRGLSAVSDDIRDLLPEECRRAFDRAWSAVVDKAIVPYSMALI